MLESTPIPAWHVFHGTNKTRPDALDSLPPPPPWRLIGEGVKEKQGSQHQLLIGSHELDCVNAALLLRRPLLVTGKPGTGKSSLAYAIAYELVLGSVLTWNITSRTSLLDGLYHYDAIGRMHDTARWERSSLPVRDLPEKEPTIARYIRLGPLGTAFLPSARPRVLLIDELDKSDIDLPNDLLNILEECSFEIPEVSRLPAEEVARMRKVRTADSQEVEIPANGRIQANRFPVIIMTSNGEREFPPAFLRRCITVELKSPESDVLKRIVDARLEETVTTKPDILKLIDDFEREGRSNEITGATDHLLNAVYLLLRDVPLERTPDAIRGLRSAILQRTRGAER